MAFYTREEAAALQGFLSAYLDRKSVSEDCEVSTFILRRTWTAAI